MKNNDIVEIMLLGIVLLVSGFFTIRHYILLLRLIWRSKKIPNEFFYSWFYFPWIYKNNNNEQFIEFNQFKEIPENLVAFFSIEYVLFLLFGIGLFIIGIGMLIIGMVSLL
jgi:hypothetical protein